MRAVLAIAAAFTAAPALAEPLEPTRGYFLGCDGEGSPVYCYVQAAGIDWAISQDSAAPAAFDQLEALPLLEPVEITGEYGELGDSSADLTLTGLSLPADDLYVGNLRAMQGQWRPQGQTTPLVIEVTGLDWAERGEGETLDTFMMSPGEACADGVVPGGMAISLYRFGDDPGADGCWQVEFIDDASMTLRDWQGDQGQVNFVKE